MIVLYPARTSHSVGDGLSGPSRSLRGLRGQRGLRSLADLRTRVLAHALRLSPSRGDGPRLVPVRLGDHLGAVAAVHVPLGNLGHLLEEALVRVERNRLKAKQLELVVLHVELVLGVLLPRVRDLLDLGARDLR